MIRPGKLLSYLINPRSSTWQGGEQMPEVEPRRVPWKGIFNPPFVLGAVIIIFLVVIVWFGPHFASYDPYITSRSVPSYYDVENQRMVRPPFDPGPEYPLGTDRFGNDILSLLFFGARVTLISCLYITAGRVILGLVLGGLSGWNEGSIFDRLISRLSTVITSIPLLLSAMLMILALDIQKGLWVFVVSLSVLGWTEIGQLVRGEFIRIKEMLYIEAAEALGLTRLQTIIRHALPNVLSYLLSIAFLEMGSILLILAELGFLGLFVGGGSRYFSDPFSPVIIQISEIPEWGALVAQGTPYLRTYPYMVLGPAVAFFIAILGLNAFGEGLRRIFDRWPFSTAFILKKRMLVITAGFVLLTAWIFQNTNAGVSYQQVAQDFNQASATARFEELKIYNDIAREDQSNPVVDYVVGKFKEYEIQPGWSETLTSLHYYPVEVTLARPEQDPTLAVDNADVFQFQKEFGFLTRGCAGSGTAAGPLFFSPVPLIELDPGEFAGLEGGLMLIQEQDFSEETLELAAGRKLGGILVVTDQQPPLDSEYEINLADNCGSCQEYQIPAFMITAAVARRIAARGELAWDSIVSQTGGNQAVIPLDVSGRMELILGSPRTVSVPNAIGFIGGYDFDHADEIVVIYTSFDGLGLGEVGQQGIPEEDLAKIAALLEIMRTWTDNQLDPRRSVQFILWGGEGVQEPFYDMLYGIFEKNKLVAKVPTNMNPYLNTNPVKPAIWVEIGDLSSSPGTMGYWDQSTEFLGDVFRTAARAANLQVTPTVPDEPGVNSGLPQIYISERPAATPAPGDEYATYTSKGVLLNRTLIQLLREMKN